MNIFSLKGIMFAVAAMSTAGACAAPTYQTNASYDAPDADLSDGVCADASGMCTLSTKPM